MALVNSYKGLIFDYGGVLVHDQAEADRARMASVLGITLELFDQLYWSNRLAYDKAERSRTEYWQDIAQRAGTRVDERTIEELADLDCKSWMQFDPVMWDWIDELRAGGKRVAMLSNMPRDLGEALQLKTDRLARFDHVTLSYEARSAKPEPAIYERCLEGLQILPEEALFLDDRIQNVQGAEVLGIRSMQFTSRDELLLRLRA